MQAALGACRQAFPSRHSLAPALMQGATDPIQPDCTQPCKLHTGHHCDTSDNSNKHLCAVLCSRTAERFEKTIISHILCKGKRSKDSEVPRSTQLSAAELGGKSASAV